MTHETKPPAKSPTYLDLLTVRAGRRTGVFLEAECRGERVYMPLTVEGARTLATDLERAAQAIEAAPPEPTPVKNPTKGRTVH